MRVYMPGDGDAVPSGNALSPAEVEILAEALTWRYGPCEAARLAASLAAAAEDTGVAAEGGRLPPSGRD
jgi:hypothetical protein